MKCQYCGSENLFVQNSRMRENGTRARTHKCIDCGKTTLTKEIYASEYKELKEAKDINQRIMNYIKKYENIKKC